MTDALKTSYGRLNIVNYTKKKNLHILFNFQHQWVASGLVQMIDKVLLQLAFKKHFLPRS